MQIYIDSTIVSVINITSVTLLVVALLIYYVKKKLKIRRYQQQYPEWNYKQAEFFCTEVSSLKNMILSHISQNVDEQLKNCNVEMKGTTCTIYYNFLGYSEPLVHTTKMQEVTIHELTLGMRNVCFVSKGQLIDKLTHILKKPSES